VQHLFVMRFNSLQVIWSLAVCLLVPIVWWLSSGVTTGLQSRYQAIMHAANTCEMAERTAEEDFYEGSYLLIHYGMIESETRCEILEREYNVKAYHPGCASFENGECYNQRMWTLLNEMHCDTLYCTVQEKVDSILMQATHLN
jgi:hypothetical protein